MSNSSIDDKEWSAWAEPDGPIMLKAVSAFGDPIELNEQEAKELIKKLSELVAEIEKNKQ